MTPSLRHCPLARYVKVWVAHAPGMPGTFSPPPCVSDPDMHHGMCVTHMPWRMPGSLTGGFFWSRWWVKRSRNSWRMRNPQFYVSGKRPIALRWVSLLGVDARGRPDHGRTWWNLLCLQVVLLSVLWLLIIWQALCLWDTPQIYAGRRHITFFLWTNSALLHGQNIVKQGFLSLSQWVPILSRQTIPGWGLVNNNNTIKRQIKYSKFHRNRSHYITWRQSIL